eukprot:3139869-Pyramimonas_sp.AAC.2
MCIRDRSRGGLEVEGHALTRSVPPLRSAPYQFELWREMCSLSDAGAANLWSGYYDKEGANVKAPAPVNTILSNMLKWVNRFVERIY